MPSSVLFAILVGAGVLALVPALIRRYDVAARRADELRASPMRLLRRRSVVSERCAAPVETDEWDDDAAAGADHDAADLAARERPATVSPPASVPAAAGHASDIRRGVTVGLLAACLGYGCAGLLLHPGWWFGSLAAGVALAGYLVLVRRALRARAAALVRRRAQQSAHQRQARAFFAMVQRRIELDDAAAASVQAWLVAAPGRRAAPSSLVRRVLAAVGREPHRDGASWVVRPLRGPQLAVSHSAPPRVAAVPRAGSFAGEAELDAKVAPRRVVGL